MAVKIKGMWTPNSCFECPLCLINGYGERFCYVDEHTVKFWDSDERPDDCPIEECEE